jgi:hypothetical protein
VLTPFGIGGATVSSSSAEDVGETVTGSGHTLINSRGTTGGRGSAGMTINAGLENGKPGRAVKRDSEGFPKRTKAQADAEEEEGEDRRGGGNEVENGKDDEDDEETGSGRTEERILSVVEETSFDLDKVSLQLHFSWARGSNRAHQPAFFGITLMIPNWVENLGFGLGSYLISHPTVFPGGLHLLTDLITCRCPATVPTPARPTRQAATPSSSDSRDRRGYRVGRDRIGCE